MAVLRYDVGGLGKPVKEPNGWMRVDAFLGRTGVQAYRRADGTVRLEYRPPDEVFKADSLASFAAVPFTNDHPPEPLDATNTKKYQVGHLVGAPVQDGDKMRASILVTDAATIADMEAGKTQLSNGYFCDCDETSGTTPEGQRYDAVQKNIIGNHCALVAEGRAGPAVKARMDSASAEMLLSNEIPIDGQSGGTKTMKIKIDGIEVEVADQTAQLIEKERATLAASTAQAKADADKAAARADSLEKDLKDAKASAAEAPTKARAEIETRMKLEATVKTVCGAETKTDGVDSKELRKLVAATQADVSTKLDEKSEAYIEVLFDKAVAQFTAKADEKAAVAEVIAKTKAVEPVAQKPKTFEEAAKERFKNAVKNQ